MAANKTYQFKLVLLGDTSVGKSSIVIRFVKGQFSEYQESTIGAAFLTQTVPVQDCTVKFEIWDTAGQERYHSLAPMYYRGAAAAIVVYDITSLESFQRAKSWVKELQMQGSPDVVIALAGNKIDREDDREVSAEVMYLLFSIYLSIFILRFCVFFFYFFVFDHFKQSKQEAKQYADDNGLFFIETSAKTNVNVRDLFSAIARKLPKVQ